MGSASLSDFTRPATTLQEALAWFHFLPTVSEQGAQWHSNYVGDGGLELAIKLDRGVTLLRRRKLAAGLVVLGECRAEIDKMEEADGSIHMLTESNYWIALAYYHYHTDQGEEGKRCLDLGSEWLERTLEAAPFLIPCAGRFYDFCLHYARLARNQGRWLEMWEHLQRGREMVRGERPLCRRGSSLLYMDDIYRFFAPIIPANQAERDALAWILDRDLAIQAYENRATGVTVTPFMVLDGLGR